MLEEESCGLWHGLGYTDPLGDSPLTIIVDTGSARGRRGEVVAGVTFPTNGPHTSTVTQLLLGTIVFAPILLLEESKSMVAPSPLDTVPPLLLL